MGNVRHLVWAADVGSRCRAPLHMSSKIPLMHVAGCGLGSQEVDWSQMPSVGGDHN
jgi:hypothetical protein